MASGDTLIVFTPLHNEPTVASAATFDTRNQHTILDFDGGSDNEIAVFKGIMPRHYDNGGVTVYVHYTMSSAGINASVLWGVAFERLQGSVASLSGDSFAAYNNIWQKTLATPAMLRIGNVSFTNGADMDSVADGDGLRLKLTRRASVTASDNAAGDAEFWGLEIKET
jgi:hypothetical protein